MEKACTLQDAVGRSERCPGETCPFWERGAGCVLEAVETHLRSLPAVAQHLLEIRSELDRVRVGADELEGRRLFYRLLNSGRE